MLPGGTGGNNGAWVHFFRGAEPGQTRIAPDGLIARTFLARDAQALAALPQTLAADAELVRQLGFGHVVLMLQDKVLEVVFQ